MSEEIRARYGGQVVVEQVVEGVRLTCTDHEDDEIAVVYLAPGDIRRLIDALGGAA